MYDWRLTLCTLLEAVPFALAGVKEVWWNVTYVQGVNPDGLFPRRVIGVNNTWPAPPIDLNSSDSLIVHVTNSLDKPTSLQHHGLFFNSTSWMDGVIGTSECGIPPGESFDYVIGNDTAGQWGTFWVHAAGGQYVDGLRAPLLLHPPTEVHEYDEEFTVILGDWYHDEHSKLLAAYINDENPDGKEPDPDSGLIYYAQESSYLAPIDGGSDVGFNEHSTLPFVSGKTYRLRLINTSAFVSFVFWIDGHDMTVIEVDGVDVEESPIEHVSMAAGQRYSVLVKARNDSTQNWAVHANMDFAMFDTFPSSLKPNLTSSVTYAPEVPVTDLGRIPAYEDVDDLSLVPIEKITQPNSTRTIELEVKFENMEDCTNRATFNDISYTSPLVPSVFTELSLGPDATAPEAYGPSTYVFNPFEVVDIVIRNGDVGKHSFHLHGHKFALVGRSKDYTSSNITLNPPIVEGQANPMRRDTVQIPPGQSATLRVVADNPGVWLLQSQIEWHQEAGLSVKLVEAPLLAQQRNNVPEVMFENCKKLGSLFSGNAAGHDSPTDLTGLPLGPQPLEEDKFVPRSRTDA